MTTVHRKTIAQLREGADPSADACRATPGPSKSNRGRPHTPVRTRVRVLMVHAPRYSFQGQARLAADAGVSRSTISRLMTGRINLTFVTANGWCRPTAAQLAAAMGVGEGKARSRLGRLSQFRWQGRPLVTEVTHEGGQDSFVPSPTAVGLREEAPTEPAPPPPAPTAGREAIVAYTRATYARPRAEVERMIAEQMGWGPPAFEGEDPAVAEGKRRAYKAMTDLGVPRDQALELLGRHDLGRVERQLAWLPLRRAKTPARFLVAAVENDYEAPVAVRLDQVTEKAAAPGDVPPEEAASPLPADESGRP